MRIYLISRLYILFFDFQLFLLSFVESWMPRSKYVKSDFKKHQAAFKKKIEGKQKLNLGYLIDEKWIDGLAFITQVSPHKASSNYFHGYVLYDLLSVMTRNSKQDDGCSINIIETGTAKGFSALCMAKALSDADYQGKILTIDLLSNRGKLFWNSIADENGKQSRASLLGDYRKLLEQYCLFVQGESRCVLRSIDFGRVHFAFIDSLHDGETALSEAKLISSSQKSGDQILFDDYNAQKFPNMIGAIEQFCEKHNYSGYEIKGIEGRNYFLAEKI